MAAVVTMATERARRQADRRVAMRAWRCGFCSKVGRAASDSLAAYELIDHIRRRHPSPQPLPVLRSASREARA